MILAAGFGTRMGALTRDRPKPLIEVAGRPLIDHALAQARHGGADAHRGQRPLPRRTRCAPILRPMHDVAFSEEQPQILDSGGGIRHALPLLRRRFLYPERRCGLDRAEPARHLAAMWDPDRMDILALLVPRARHRAAGGGRFRADAAGRLAFDPAGSSIPARRS